MSFQDEFYNLTRDFYSAREKLSKINEKESDSLAKHVGWQSHESQQQNFEVATNLENINWSAIDSVLDVGCGYGELARYLRAVKGFEGTYTGVDILDHFIDRAVQTYGDDPRNIFICSDILSCNQLCSSYDIVISMGTLSVNYDYPSPCGEKTQYFTENLIELICSLAKRAVILYFLNKENTTFMERALAGNTALYNSKDIYNTIKNKIKMEYKNFTMESYPNPKSFKAITKIYYK